MADFTIPYRAFKPIDPTRGVRQGFNALVGVEQLKDRQRRTGQMERRTDQMDKRIGIAEKGQQMDAAKTKWEFEKRKASDIGAIAARIKNLPADQAVEQWRKVYDSVIPTPIVENSPFGELGAISQDGFLTPEQIGALPDDKRKGYFDALYKDAKDISNIDIENLKHQNILKQKAKEDEIELNQLKKLAGYRMAQIERGGQLDIELERERQKAPSGGTTRTDKDIITTPDGGNYSLKQLVEIYGKQFDVPKSIADAAGMGERVAIEELNRIVEKRADAMPLDAWLKKVRTDGLPPWGDKKGGNALQPPPGFELD